MTINLKWQPKYFNMMDIKSPTNVPVSLDLMRHARICETNKVFLCVKKQILIVDMCGNTMHLNVETALICLGCNKDLCSQRSKYKSYGALRGCNLGVRDCLQVYCGK